MIEDYDVEELRQQLIDYYGTAMFNGNPVAVYDLEKAKYMFDEDVIEEAKLLGLI